MSQGSNKFRDKRRTNRVNGQSKATDEVESECEGQQGRVRQRKRRVGWWWKEKSRLRHHTGWPYTYLMFSVIIPVCFPLCINLHLNSNQVEARTLEMAPEGAVLLELNHVSSRSLRAHWTAPSRPNGNLIYTLHYKSKGSSGHLFSQFLATQTTQADIMQDITQDIMQDITQGHSTFDIFSIFDPHDFVSHQ